MEKKKLNLKEIGMGKIIILFLTGVFLLILSVPSFQKKENTLEEGLSEKPGIKKIESSGDVNSIEETYTNRMEKRLTDTLEQAAEIGKVKVMITLKGSSEKVTLKEEPFTQENGSESDGRGGTRVNSSLTHEDKAVLVSQSSGESMPYVIKETLPEIQGIVVLAEGAGNSKLIGEIVEAVQVLFDVPIHKIKVMKMEGVHH
ncbi:MAG: stage III sporulation protein AG [Acetivibrio sp.]